MSEIKEFLKKLAEEHDARAAGSADAAPVEGAEVADMMTTNVGLAAGMGDEAFYATQEQLAQLEKDFDRTPVRAEVPSAEPAVAPAPEPTPADFAMPPTSYMHRGIRHKLIVDGVCVDCARCGMKLTDSVSIERGLGPDCSAKGYLEDPMNSDEMQAFIDLAEYPELCTYLTAKYKPQGARGLMNGLVKIAALNRKAPGLFSSICDAIDSLGYKRLAASLRDSIAIIEIKESKRDPSCYSVWVKKGEWSYSWQSDLKRVAGLGPYDRMRPGDNKGVLVPKSVKRGLWEMMLKHYPGYVAKTPAGTIKIERATIDAGTKEEPKV